MNMSRRGNSYLQLTQPWDKSTSKERQSTALCTCANLLRLLAAVAEPFMPSVSAKLLVQLNCTLDTAPLADAHLSFELTLPASHKIGLPRPLFRRIEATEIVQLRNRFH